VPWISVFDPAITTSATQGVVYLFHVSDPVVHLSLNQGTTAVREEFGSRAREILQDRADLMRKRIAEYSDALPTNKIDLGSNARLPGDYVAGQPTRRTDGGASSLKVTTGMSPVVSAGIAAPHHRQIVELPSLLRFVQESAT
jgi:hypothetical protein